MKSDRIFNPPDNIAKRNQNNFYFFLGGSIGKSSDLTILCEDWQKDMEEFLLSLNSNIGIFNPRRKDWDSSWEQKFQNPQFFQQVCWELNALKNADYIIINLIPETFSPISLLELGLFINKNIYVICPDGFWRKGNVDIVCNIYNIPLFDCVEDFKIFINNKVNENIIPHIS